MLLLFWLGLRFFKSSSLINWFILSHLEMQIILTTTNSMYSWFLSNWKISPCDLHLLHDFYVLHSLLVWFFDWLLKCTRFWTLAVCLFFYWYRYLYSWNRIIKSSLQTADLISPYLPFHLSVTGCPVFGCLLIRLGYKVYIAWWLHVLNGARTKLYSKFI